MNLLDLGILVLLGLVTIRGYYRGLFQELALVVGLVGGVVVASHTYLRLAEHLSPWITDPFYAGIIAFGIILIVVYWLTYMVAHALQRLLYALYLDFFERLLGALFALAKGALFIGFGLMFLALLLPKDSQLLKESRMAPELTHISHQALELLPPDFKMKIQDNLRGLQKQLERKKSDESTAGLGPLLGDQKRVGRKKPDEGAAGVGQRLKDLTRDLGHF